MILQAFYGPSQEPGSHHAAEPDVPFLQEEYTLDADDLAYRRKLAHESRERKQAEAKALLAQQAAMGKRLQTVRAATDDNIDDEPAGIRREQLRAESIARRKSTQALLQRANSDLKQRLGDVRAKIDADISDEHSGRLRAEYAAASARRRAEEHARVARENRELQERLRNVKAATDDGDGLRDGRSLSPKRSSSPPLERGSEVHIGMMMKLENYEANRKASARLKQELDEQRQRRELEAAERLARGQRNVLESQERHKRSRQLQGEKRLANQNVARELRLEEEHWKRVRAARRREFEEEARKRVLEAKTLDARLDAEEEARDAAERAEMSKMREGLRQALEETRASGFAMRRRQAEAIRAETEAAVQHRGVDQARQAARTGEEKRSRAREWSSRRTQAEEEYLEKARANRERALKGRANAKLEAVRVLSERKAHAVKEKGNDHLVTEERERILESNRREVQEVYKRRFAPKKVALRWEKSPLSSLYASAGSWLGASMASSGAGWGAGGKTPRTPRTPRTPGRRSPVHV